MNPLAPTTGEVTVLVLGSLVVVLWAVAVRSLAKDRHYTSAQRLLWLLVVLAAPVVGTAPWLTVGRRSAVPVDGTAASADVTRAGLMAAIGPYVKRSLGMVRVRILLDRPMSYPEIGAIAAQFLPGATT